jgi:2-phospho-L-lactate guanylyltransferase
MRTWAIVPVKQIHLAKSRLARVLSDAAREDLVQRMLEHTLRILQQSRPRIEGTLVVSSDPRVLSLAIRHSAEPLAETGLAGLNAALAQAVREAGRRGAQEILILPSDLPKLSAQALTELLDQSPPPPGVVIAPDHRETGTNALALRPAGVIEPVFGRGSFRRHCVQARRRNVRVVVFRSPALALDVDTPADLEQAGDILS